MAHQERIEQIERHQRRGEDMARLKAARRAARRDVIQAGKWLGALVTLVAWLHGIIPTPWAEAIWRVLGSGN